MYLLSDKLFGYTAEVLLIAGIYTIEFVRESSGEKESEDRRIFRLRLHY